MDNQFIHRYNPKQAVQICIVCIVEFSSRSLGCSLTQGCVILLGKVLCPAAPAWAPVICIRAIDKLHGGNL